MEGLVAGGEGDEGFAWGWAEFFEDSVDAHDEGEVLGHIGGVLLESGDVGGRIVRFLVRTLP